MNKFLQIFALFLLSSIFSLSASAQAIDWVKTAGGVSNDNGQAIQLDNAGNIYVLGYFSGPSATFGNINLSTAGTGTYLAKYTNAGVVAWARKISDTDVSPGGGLRTDGAGNSYLTVTFTGSVTLGSNTYTNSGTGGDIIIAKYDASGNVTWAKRAGGTAADKGNSITIDASGNSYVTGSFVGSASFGTTTLTSAGSSDAFVTKLDANGNFQWAQRAGSTAADEGTGIVVDASGNVYVAGNFAGSVVLGGTTLASSGGQDIFLAAYANSGSLSWAQKAGGTGTDKVTSLAIDGSNNLYLGGNYSGTANFGTNAVTSRGGQDVFLARYNASGTNVWARTAGSTGTDELNGLTADADGNLYLIGSFSGTASFGSINIITTGALDIFTAHYISSGAVQWAIGAGSGVDDRGYGVITDRNRNAYVTGYFQGETTSFGGIPIPNNGGEEIFISRLQPALKVTTVTAGPHCPGNAITVTYSTNTSFSGSFRAELSDATGSFASPVSIGSVASNTGTISAVIPANTPASSKYRIRVFAVTANMPGADNGTDITINATPPVPVLSATSPSAGGTLYLSAAEIPGATYSWTGPNSFTSNLREPSRANMRTSDAGNYTLTVNVKGCSNTATIAVVLATVPSFDVDLSANPNATWTSAAVSRNGSNCGGNNCIQFNVRLHKDAGQIEVTVDGGSGSMTYIINCDDSAPKNANEPVCITNTGILTITSCKPGGNANRYTVKSIAAFEPQVDISVTAGCSDILKAPLTFNESSIVWEDLTGNGTYLKYLSFPNGKKEAVVTGDENAPAFVDYRVRGTSLLSTCAPTLYYDDIRVYFLPKPVVTIGPTPAIICPGGTGVLLTGNVTGGDGNFQYFWTDATGTVVANTQNYTATAVGVYHLEVRNKNYPNCEKFSSSVTVVSNLTVSAGPDQLACASSPVQLAGAVTAATGGIWSGGSGTFSNATALNAVYTPSAADLNAGSVRLRLTSTGNGSCTAVSDEVLITFYNMTVNLTGSAVICNGTLGTVNATVTGAQGTVGYRWNTGETTASISNKPAGTYTVTVTDSRGCQIVRSFTVTEVFGPTNFAATPKNTTCGASNGEILVGAVTGGTGTYTYSKDGTNYQAAANFTGLAVGTHTITVKDANGCTFARSFTLTNTPGPTAVSATTQPASCADNNGSITVGTPTGGTAPYSYSINGTTFQTGTTFTGRASGTYTVTARDANGCLVTSSVVINKVMPTDFTATPAASTCGNSNGSVTVSAVVGGATPYTYSKDGTSFQASATLTGFAAGTHLITVRDNNGCTFAKQVTITNIAGPSNITANLTATTCGNSNGTITATAVGGTAGYTYSKDGTNFQASATFTGLAAGTHNITVKDANGCTFAKDFTLTNVTGPAAVAGTSQPASCLDNNGSITVGTVSGGTAPYSYSINGTAFQTGTTFTGLASGNYTITARDANGCTVTEPVTINKVTPTDFTLTAVASTCGNSNGTVTVSNVVGGAASYTYSKNGTTFQADATLTGLAAGTHTITVKDANGCTFAKQVTVTNIAGPSDLTATVKASTCGSSNGEFAITAVGGTAPYTYSINGGAYQTSASFTGLTAATYSVRVRDNNGCVYTEAVVVTNIAGPAVTAAAVSSTCGNSNGQVNVTVTGGTAPFSYSKDGTNFQTAASFTNLVAGNYTITVKDANNCVQTAAVTVNNVAGPTDMTLVATSSTCGNSNGSISVTNTTGGTAAYTYSIDGTNFQSATSFSGLAARGYTVRVKDANGCIFSKNITVNNIAGPTDLTAAVTATTCGASNGQFTITVTGGTAAYTYSLDGTNFQTSATFAGLAAATYNVTVRDARGCTYTEAVVITNIAGPTGFTAQAQTSSCGRNNGSITVSGILGGTSPYTYSRNGTTFQESPIFTSLLSGTYTIRIKDANGCTFARQVDIADVAGPTDFALTTASSTCGASNGTITVGAVTGGTSGYTYSINGGAFQPSASFTALAAATYTVTVRDANGCTFAKQAVVTNIAGPTDLTAAVTATTCGASNGELTVTAVGGTAGYTYSKDGTNFQPSATFTGLAAGTHNITVKDANGCTFAKAFTITNIAGPTAVAATTQPTSCANNDGSIAVGAVTGGTAPYMYSINGTTFQTGTSFTALASGTYTVTARDNNGCLTTRSVTVNRNVPTNFAATSTSSTCGNSNGKILVGAVTGGFGPYTYSKDGTTFQASAELTGFAAGSHTITIKDAKGCTFAKAVTVTNIAGPSDLTAAVKASTCGSSNGELSVTPTGGTAPYTYSINGNNYQSAAAFTGILAGSYTVYVKDNNGCIYSETVVVPDISGPNFTASPVSSTCGNSNGSISVSDVSGGVAPYSYSKDGTNFQPTASFTALAAGNYNISVKDANGCVLTKPVTVENIAGPTDMILTAVSSTCGRNNGSILVSGVTGGTSSYTFSMNSTNFQAAASFGTLLAGNYTITVKDANGCTFAKAVTVENIAGPTNLTATATATTCGASNGELRVTAVGGTAGYTYSKDGVNFQEAATFTALAAGNHTITVKDANGCIFAKQFTVTNIAGPTAVAATAVRASCLNNDGSITAGTITGGTAPYTYSINGTSFQEGTAFAGLATGTYTLTAKDANGCTVTASVSVGRNVPTTFASSSVSSTCGASNGTITVGVVSGGTAPYTYSKDGTNFQALAELTGFAAGTHTITVKDAKGCVIARQVTVTNIAGPTDLSASATPSTCGNSNGSVTVSGVTGGTAGYTYSKDGTNFQASATFTALAEGTYSITVKDANGCTFTKEVAVSNVAGPVFTATAQATTCGSSNGSISINEVTAGTAPYTYSIDGTNFSAQSTFTGLRAATYTITVRDANGCELARTVEVNDIAGPAELVLASASSTCGSNNGTITVNSVSGGTAPYTYALNGGAFQSAATFGSVVAGTYTIAVRDANGCLFTKTVVVENVAGPNGLTAAATASTCGARNGELTVTNVAGGVAPYTYSRDGVNFQEAPAFTGLLAGSHTITVRDANGCIFARSFTITNIAGPTAVAANTQPATCADNDGRLTAGAVTGGTAPYTYSINGTTFQAGISFTGLASGVYTVTAKDANGCTVTASVTVDKNVPTNFASTTVASTCGRSDGSLTVGTVTGGTAPYTYSKDGTTFQTSATFTALAAGSYNITVKDANGCTFAKAVSVGNVAGPVFTATSQRTTCSSNNGSITVGAVTGGVAPYTYSKDGVTFQAGTVFADVTAGNYTITVKDANGCLGTTTVEVEDIAGPAAFELTVASSTCGNANASLTVGAVTGGTAPYTYSRNGTTFQSSTAFAGLAAGSYTITVKDATGCTVTRTVEVEDIAGPSELTLTAVASTCGSNNGSVSVSAVTGGTAPYAFALNGTTFVSEGSFRTLVAGEYTVTVRDANGCTFATKISVTDIAGPTDLTASTTSSTCGRSDGSLTVTDVTGGTASYTYSKDGVNFQASATFAALAAGNHSITVKDANGCTFAKTITITNTGGPTAVAAATLPASCSDNDGRINVGTVTGGVAPYTYSVNGTTFQESTAFAGLASGEYTVTVKDANGCEVTTTVRVSKNVPTAFASTTAASTCGSSNGSITVGAVTGGTAPYTYSINGTTFQTETTFAGLLAGTHTITVRDANGCTFASQVQVTNIAGPAALVAALRSSTCGSSNGGFTVSSVTGGTAPYTYSINGTSFQASATFAALLSGDYQVTVKDANGCIFSDDITIENIPGPSEFATTLQTTSCGRSNGSITVGAVTGGTAPYTYSKDGVNFQTAAAFTALAAGEHTITVKDANGCEVTKQVTLEDVAGPADLMLVSTTSTCGARNGTISVSGVTGGTAPYIYSINGTNFQAATTFEAILAGEHTITVRDANGCTFAKKVVVEDVAGPTNLTASTTASTCGASNGSLIVTGVTGGTAPYTYSKDGVNFQAAAAFTALAAGNHTITVKDANGCTFEKVITVTDIAGPAAVAATSQAASCADNDGRINVGTVTGGVAPYTYSINGTTFQESTAFAGLASGEYTVTVKDANGCEARVAVTIVKDGPAAFAAAVAASTCGSSNGSISVNTVTGGTAPYTYSMDGTTFQRASTFTALLAGTYTITVKDANGCTFAKEVAVTNITGPTDLVANVNATTCGTANGQITIATVTGGTAAYTYSINGTSFQAGATFASLAAGEYQVTIKDANGCIYTKAVVVPNISGPADFVLTPRTATCGGSNGQATVGTVTGGTAPYTYSKDGVSFQAAATLTGFAAGTHTITIKDANGCTFSKTVVIENVAGPTDVVLTSITATCGGNNGSINAGTVTGGTAPYSYSINGADFQASATFAAVLAGEHTITVRDANGCTVAAKIVVGNVAGPANMDATIKPSTCGASNGEVTITAVTGGTAPYRYSLDGTTFQASATFTALAAGEFTITVQDANGCTVAQQVRVTNENAATAIATSTTPTSCLATDGTITVNGVTGGAAPYTYSLDGSTYQSAATFASLEAKEHTVFVKDANGCVASFKVTVGAKGIQEATATATAASCGEDNGSVTVGTVTGGTAPYTYAINGTTFQVATTFRNLAAGSYTITVKDTEGCTTEVVANVVNAGGVESFTLAGTNASCGASNGQVLVSNITGGQGPYTYSINSGSFQASERFTGLAAGTYQVAVKDALGCIHINTVTIENTPPLAEFTMNVTAAGCGQTTGQVEVTGVTGGTAPYTYSLDGTTFSAATTITNVLPGSYILTVKDASGCTLTKPVVIGSNSSKLTYVRNISCFGEKNGAIAIETVGGNADTEYSIDNGATYQKNPVFNNLAKGNYQVLTRIAPGCIISLGTVEVKEPEVIQVTVTPQKSAVGQDNTGSATVTVKGGSGTYTYQLNNGQFTAAPALENLRGGKYILLVKDSNGCTKEVSFTIESTPDEVLGDIDIPNGFTPNGDGVNDRWVLRNLSVLYPNCNVMVFNRWGSLVFESKGYRTAWDGTHNGKRLPDGTYYTIIELGNGKPALKKSVTIMR